MKKSSIILGASAVVLAIASAFTTKSKAVVGQWTGGVGTVNSCVKYTTLCTNGTNTNFTGVAPCTQGATIFTSYQGISKCQFVLQVNRNVRP